MTAVSFGNVSLASALCRSRVARLMPPIPSKPACNAPRRLTARRFALRWMFLSFIEFFFCPDDSQNSVDYESKTGDHRVSRRAAD